MPEIRLGASENLASIRLGSSQVEEVRLGNVLVWQNNQGPIFANIVFDGTTFTPVAPGEELTGTATPFAGTYNANVNTTNLTFNSVTDPDNVPPLQVDRIVGFRVRRADGTYAFGDPASTGNRPDGAPIADYGDAIPGQTYAYDAANDEFTAGPFTIARIVIPLTFRDTDVNGVIVNSNTVEFLDTGDWEFFILDSRGGESPMATITMDLEYQAPSQTVNSPTAGAANLGAVQNATVGGPSTITLRANPTGGPVDNYTWQCTGNCAGVTTGTGASINNVSVPQSAAGNAAFATWTVTATGRAWNGNDARTSMTTVNVRSGVSCTISVTVNDGSSTLNDGCARFGSTNQMLGDASCTSIRGTTGCNGFSNRGGGRFNRPNPTCRSGQTFPDQGRVSVGASVILGGSTITGGGSRTYTGGTPSARYTCNVNLPGNYVQGRSFDQFRDSPTCTDTTPATLTISGTAACILPFSPGAPACGTASSPSRSCGSSSTATCTNVPRNGSGSASATCPQPTPGATMPNTSISVSGGTYEWRTSGNVVCYDGTLTFSGSSTHRIGGSVSFNATCTNGRTGQTRSLRRGEGTSGHGPGSWTERDFGIDCSAFSATGTQATMPGDTIDCSSTLNYFISGFGTVTVGGPSGSVTVS